MKFHLASIALGLFAVSAKAENGVRGSQGKQDDNVLTVIRGSSDESTENIKEASLSAVAPNTGKEKNHLPNADHVLQYEVRSGESLSDAAAEALLGEHNSFRSTTALGNTPNQPMATNMQKLIWDTGLVSVAQAHTDKCLWQFSGSGNGENLSYSTSVSNVAATLVGMVTGWYNKYTVYDYDSPSSSTYAQVVWANSLRLGCAYTVCGSGLPGETTSSTLMLTCLYSPGGNYVGQKPYISTTDPGQVASNCPTGYVGNDSSGLCEEEGSEPTAPTPAAPTPSPTTLSPTATPRYNCGSAPCYVVLEIVYDALKTGYDLNDIYNAQNATMYDMLSTANGWGMSARGSYSPEILWEYKFTLFSKEDASNVYDATIGATFQGQVKADVVNYVTGLVSFNSCFDGLGGVCLQPGFTPSPTASPTKSPTASPTKSPAPTSSYSCDSSQCYVVLKIAYTIKSGYDYYNVFYAQYSTTKNMIVAAASGSISWGVTLTTTYLKYTITVDKAYAKSLYDATKDNSYQAQVAADVEPYVDGLVTFDSCFDGFNGVCLTADGDDDMEAELLHFVHHKSDDKFEVVA